jgi:hypothetical protein
MHYLSISVFFKILTELSLSQSLEMTMMSSLHGTWCAKMFPCHISDTLIASDNENDTCTSISEEVDITHNGHGNIFAHHVPCNDDIIVISSDCENDR